MIRPIYENIPQELKTRTQWVNWKAMERNGKVTKPPFQSDGKFAESNNPATWNDFNTVKAAAADRFDGIGFVLTEDDPYVAIDFDNCYCPAFEIIDPVIEHHIKYINTYTEISPSGRGLRVLLRGRLPVGGRKNGRVEVYQDKRYVTVTGNILTGYQSTIESRQLELETFYKKAFPEKPEDSRQTPGNFRQAAQSLDFVWRDRLQTAFSSKNGVNIKRLYDGDISGYPSQSEADMSLCSHLAFWLNGDAAAIDGAFRESGLYRDKWDKKHYGDGRTYGKETIMKATGQTTETYFPKYSGAKKHDTKATDEWPEPLRFGEIETPELPSSLLPTYLGKYCEAVTKAVQTPSGLAVMFCLSTVAACLQKRFEVSPYGDDYTEPLSLWTNTALEPGNRKTFVKNAMVEPLTSWESEQAELLKPKIMEVNHRRDINLKRIEQLKAKVAKPDTPANERETALQEIIQIENETPDEIKVPRIWTDDVTPERLQALMAENDERMTLLSDEGGIFEVMAGLYSNGRANINVFLQGHAGAPVRVDRQGRSVTLNKPALSFGLAVQPEIIVDLAEGRKKHFRGNGTLARFLYCIPVSTLGTRDVTHRCIIPESIKIEYRAGVMALLAIDPIYDEHGQEQPRILTLTPDALRVWERFSQYIESMQGPNGECYNIQDWTSKLPGAALRIAGLFHVVEHGTLIPALKRETMERALDLCELLIVHARAAFDLMGDDADTNDAKALFKWIEKKNEPTFKQNDAFKENRRFRKVDRLERALKVLTSRHIIGEPMKRVTGGRPSVDFDVNPQILKPMNRVQMVQKGQKTTMRETLVPFNPFEPQSGVNYEMA